MANRCPARGGVRCVRCVLRGPSGDGLVAGRHLSHFGYDVAVHYPKRPAKDDAGRLFSVRAPSPSGWGGGGGVCRRPPAPPRVFPLPPPASRLRCAVRGHPAELRVVPVSLSCSAPDPVAAVGVTSAHQTLLPHPHSARPSKCTPFHSTPSPSPPVPSLLPTSTPHRLPLHPVFPRPRPRPRPRIPHQKSPAASYPPLPPPHTHTPAPLHSARRTVCRHPRPANVCAPAVCASGVSHVWCVPVDAEPCEAAGGP
jgi:hypothetical protein